MRSLSRQWAWMLAGVVVGSLLCTATHAAEGSAADGSTSSEVIQPGELPESIESVDSGFRLPSLGEISWSKNGFRLVPYGAFWGDVIYATSRTYPGAYTLWVESEEDQGEPAFTIDVRRTRLGLDVTGPAATSYFDESGGKVEIDFQGAFVTENKASVLLRHAYWEVGNESLHILFGQTWDVVSPLYPHTVNYSVGWDAGNIGYRRAQLRIEKDCPVTDSAFVTLQASLNQDITSDFTTEAGVEPEPTSWPVVEGRAAITWGWSENAQQATTLGISGHIGETGFDFLTTGPPPLNLPPEDDARFRTWSFNVDIYAPLSNRCGFQGEYFTGANLSSFLGGVGQGVCPCMRVPIRASGGWGEYWYDLSPVMHAHVGYGLDDPNNNDMFFGRRYNQFMFANIFYDINEHFTTALEVTYWKTLYMDKRSGLIPDSDLTPSAPGNSVTIDWMFEYAF